MSGADACFEAQLAVLMAVGRKYSGYYEQLKDDIKKRYNEKLNIIGEAVDDPYTFSSGLGIDLMRIRIYTIS